MAGSQNIDVIELNSITNGKHALKSGVGQKLKLEQTNESDMLKQLSYPCILIFNLYFLPSILDLVGMGMTMDPVKWATLHNRLLIMVMVLSVSGLGESCGLIHGSDIGYLMRHHLSYT